MKRFLWLIVCLLAFGARADRVDKIVKSEMAKLRIPGVALAIIQKGKCVKTGVYGYSNLELKTPVTADTVFEIGSITKQFTAACIMILVQEGKLSVDDPISKYLTNTPPSWSKITIRNLLTHTSGIKNYTGLNGFELTRHLTQEQFIEEVGALPLDFQPGDKYSYCNTGFNLLGYIIENVSAEDYWDFFGEHILRPLGMNATTSRNPRTIIPNRADGYEQTKDGTLVNRDYDLTDLFSAGSIVSTVGDLAKWNAVLNTDEILFQSSKQEMWTPTRLNDGSFHQYGFAWMLSPLEGHRRISHTGETSGFNASFARFPNDRLAVIVLCNAGKDNPAEKLANEIAPLYFLKSVTKK